MQAIKDYDTNKWKVIGQKVGKPAKVSSSLLFSLILRFARFSASCNTLRDLLSLDSRRLSAHAVGADFNPTRLHAYTL
jgi:hypothetical protein